MGKRKNIYVVIGIILILGLVIEFIRLDLGTKLSTNENTSLIDLAQGTGVKISEMNNQTEQFLIIYDENKEEFIKIKENFERVLSYIKIGYDSAKVSDVSSINPKYTSVILIMENLDRLRTVNELMEYVFEGGNLLVAFRLGVGANFNTIYRKLGIYEFGDYYTANGIRFMNNVLLKSKGLEIKEPDFFVNSSMGLRISDDSELLAESMEGVSLLWKKKYGQGNIIYFNGTILGDKKNRGLILGSISLLDDYFIYPIINAKINFIDDFPAPVPEGRNEIIFQEYGRTIPRFYKDIWWPNVLEIGSKYNIKYTGVIIGSYNDETGKIEPGSTDLDMSDLTYYGREIISHGGEIGLHGYNHQSLAMQPLVNQELGYNAWKDAATMVDGIKEVIALAQKAFPNYTLQVYVPPSNILYLEGRQALLAAETGIKIISSLYSKGPNLDAYEQEFAIADDGIIEFPRLTAGYEYTAESLWTMINGITMHGFFSHFIHPDDILDNSRSNGKTWSQLLKEFDKFSQQVFDDYPWVRGMTASEGANEMINYRLIEPKYEKTEEYLKVTIDNFFGETFFILRSKKPIESVENASVKVIDENVYLVQIDKPVFQINFDR
ncbi:MAG: DUF2194 domain-containing protein [Thermincola sp.]|jgi:hypothetical protein|nr:DUF2194 domain-containing protein [Thermincola sp.]MDT3704107.1 DUF2194 domain-containing protein [Thermincola sp.]